MLEQPCSKDVCGHFRKDAPFFGILFARRVVVVAAVGAVAAADAGVARVAWKNVVQSVVKKVDETRWISKLKIDMITS